MAAAAVVVALLLQWLWLTFCSWEVGLSISFFVIAMYFSISTQARQSMVHTLLFNGVTFWIPTQESVHQLETSTAAATPTTRRNVNNTTNNRHGSRTASSISSSSSSLQQQQQQQLPKYLLDQMTLLELESHEIHAGSMYLANSSTRDQLWAWRRLDITMTWALATCFGLFVTAFWNWVLSSADHYYNNHNNNQNRFFGSNFWTNHTIITCSDNISHDQLLDCWWREMYQKRFLDPIPSVSIMALVTIWLAWNVATISSNTTVTAASSTNTTNTNTTTNTTAAATTATTYHDHLPFYFRYSPSSLMTGLVVALLTSWYLHNHNDNNSPVMNPWWWLTSPPQHNVFTALEELAARWILWTRNGLGVVYDRDQEAVLDTLIHILGWILSAVCGFLALTFSSHIAKTLQLFLYQYHAQQQYQQQQYQQPQQQRRRLREQQHQQNRHQPSSRRHSNRFARLSWHSMLRVMRLLLLVTTALLPVLAVFVTAVVSPKMQSISLPIDRITLVWCFVACMLTIIIKWLLQGRLDQALPLTIVTLAERSVLHHDSGDDHDHDMIRRHFQFAIQSVVKTATQLAAFPILLTGLLSISHIICGGGGGGRHSIGTTSISLLMYPVANGEAFWTLHETQLVRTWRMKKLAERMAYKNFNNNNNKTTAAWWFWFSDRSIDNHDSSVEQHFAWLQLTIANYTATNHDSLHHHQQQQQQQQPLVHLPANGRELLTTTSSSSSSSSASLPPSHTITFAQILARLQVYVKQKRYQPLPTTRPSPQPLKQFKKRRGGGGGAAATTATTTTASTENDAVIIQSFSVLMGQTWHDGQRAALALWTHPIITCTIVYPIVDFIIVVMCSLWTVLFLRGLWSDWKPLLILSNYAAAYHRVKCE